MKYQAHQLHHDYYPLHHFFLIHLLPPAKQTKKKLNFNLKQNGIKKNILQKVNGKHKKTT